MYRVIKLKILLWLYRRGEAKFSEQKLNYLLDEYAARVRLDQMYLEIKRLSRLVAARDQTVTNPQGMEHENGENSR